MPTWISVLYRLLE